MRISVLKILRYQVQICWTSTRRSCCCGYCSCLEVARGCRQEGTRRRKPSSSRERSTNLLQHVENITDVFGLPAVVAINRFPADTEAELKLVEDSCRKLGVNVALSEVWGKGGEGGIELAEEVIRLCEAENNFTFCYDTESPIADKIKDICRKVYRAEGVEILSSARRQIRRLEKLGFGNLPVCMAKPSTAFRMMQSYLDHRGTLK